MSASPRTPSYRLHRASGQAVVTLDGRDVHLGLHGTQASRNAYDRTIAEWLANGRRLDSESPTTVAELVVRYLKFVDQRSTSHEPVNIRYALRPVRSLYGATPAVDFGPLALKAVRKQLVDADDCRSMVNKRIRMIVDPAKAGEAMERMG